MAKGIVGLAKSNTKSVKQPEKNKKLPKESGKEKNNDGIDAINARINDSVDDILKEIKASEIISKKPEPNTIVDKNIVNGQNEIKKSDEYSSEYVDWLKEQVDMLTNENNTLKNIVKQNEYYSGGGNNDDGLIKEKVLELFIELNEHYFKMKENFVINPPNFIMRLIKFFPFLEPYRRF